MVAEVEEDEPKAAVLPAKVHERLAKGNGADEQNDLHSRKCAVTEECHHPKANKEVPKDGPDEGDDHLA